MDEVTQERYAICFRDEGAVGVRDRVANQVAWTRYPTNWGGSGSIENAITNAVDLCERFNRDAKARNRYWWENDRSEPWKW